jgi:ribosomal protein S18 acetylase RimI-like enzyme
MIIREATPDDYPLIWPLLREVFRRGDTYAVPSTINEEEARRLWMEAPLRTYVAEDDGDILGTYKLSHNSAGGGDHVCNCGYIVSPRAQGNGLATAMCEHSQKMALELGFKAMQYNMVVSTNESAVRLWQKLGFEIVGTLPRGFNHPQEGYVDGHIMYKWLVE